MADDTRIVLKNFNANLLLDELNSAALPFVSVRLAGFDRASRYIGYPASRRVSRVRKPDGTYVEDVAPAGEIRFEFTAVLTDPQADILDTLLAAHDSTQRSPEQQREGRDEADLDTLIAQFPGLDSMNTTQLRRYVKLLARVYLRERRTPAI